MKTFEYTIKDELGIHARPAGMLVKEAKNFASECTITKDGKTKKLTQLMMLMSLGVTTAQYMNSMPKEGARMAMAIIIIIPIACCYPFFQKYFISGLTVGAVKG